MRMIMPRRYQYIWLGYLFPQRRVHGREDWRLWLETDAASFQAGSRIFMEHVASMLHHRGAITNLSLRENLLLPFQYHGDAETSMRAEQDLPEVAAFLGITGDLDKQTGEYSAYMHGLASLSLFQHEMRVKM